MGTLLKISSKHRKVHTRPHRCFYSPCLDNGKGFSNEGGLMRHIASVHSDPTAVEKITTTCNLPGCDPTRRIRNDKMKQHMDRNHRLHLSMKHRSWETSILAEVVLRCPNFEVQWVFQPATSQRKPLSPRLHTYTLAVHWGYIVEVTMEPQLLGNIPVGPKFCIVAFQVQPNMGREPNLGPGKWHVKLAAYRCTCVNIQYRVVVISFWYTVRRDFLGQNPEQF